MFPHVKIANKYLMNVLFSFFYLGSLKVLALFRDLPTSKIVALISVKAYFISLMEIINHIDIRVLSASTVNPLNKISWLKIRSLTRKPFFRTLHKPEILFQNDVKVLNLNKKLEDKAVCQTGTILFCRRPNC
jgi:hypothetical protein